MSEMIDIDKIQPNEDQPRKHFEGIEELAESIDQHGLIMPILVRPAGQRFEIVHGERRYRACKSLSMDKIPAEVRELSDQDAFLVSFTENLQRNDLNPMEEARALERMIDAFDYTQAEAGEVLGKSQQYIADRLSLIKLSDPVQDMITARAVNVSAARKLTKYRSEVQERLADEIAGGDMTVRKLNEVTQRLDDDATADDADKATKPRHDEVMRGMTEMWDRMNTELDPPWRVCGDIGDYINFEFQEYEKWAIGDLLNAVEDQTGSCDWWFEQAAQMIWLSALAVAAFFLKEEGPPMIPHAMKYYGHEKLYRKTLKMMKRAGWMEDEKIVYEPPLVTDRDDIWTWVDWGLNTTALLDLVWKDGEMKGHSHPFPMVNYEKLPPGLRFDPTIAYPYFLFEAGRAVGAY